MREKLVSVIIPTYCGAETVNGVVKSVLAQTYNNIEVFVVDDNGEGTEVQLKTERAISEFLKNERFHYLKHENNKNGSAARNTGLRACNGDYVAFLDDDDYFYETKIEKCVNALENSDENYAMVYTALELVYDSEKREKLTVGENGDIFENFIMGNIRIGSSSVLIKKSVLDEMHGFDESFRRHQDWEVLTRILFKYKAVYIDEILVKKVMLRRNDPKGEVFEKYRLYYLNTLSYIFNELPSETKKRLYDRHYYSIAKAYFKEKNFEKFLYWINKTSRPGHYLIQLLKDTIAFLKRK